MTTKLDIFNGALIKLGQRKIASLSENTPARHDLDGAWDSGLVNFCLSRGLWIFATRTSKFNASTDIAPDFGYAYAYERPDDYLTLCGIWSDEYLKCPLNNYRQEGNFILCELDEIYLSYISNGSDFGLNYNLWSAEFRNYVELYLATEACIKITNSETMYTRLYKLTDRALHIAKNTNAMEKPLQYPTMGTWARSRLAGYPVRDFTGRNLYG